MKEKTKNLLLAPISLLAGFCNALLGAGGGILLSLVLAKLYAKELPDRRDLLANSQAAMIPGCLLSCIFYAVGGSLKVQGFLPLGVAGVIGGAVGSILLSKVNSRIISLIFASLMIWSGFRMMVG